VAEALHESLREAVTFSHHPEEDAWRVPYLATARSRLDEASWEEAWAEGRAMPMEQAIEYALSEEKPLTPSSPASKKPSSDESPSLTRRDPKETEPELPPAGSLAPKRSVRPRGVDSPSRPSSSTGRAPGSTKDSLSSPTSSGKDSHSMAIAGNGWLTPAGYAACMKR
jgi:hypothetical protein